MKTISTFCFFALLICFARIFATPVISNIDFPTSIGKYQKFEVAFDLNAYINPYDETQIDVWAEFTSPTGRVYKVIGFYYEGYTKVDAGNPTSDEILLPNNLNGWRLRFSPNETGVWSFQLHAMDPAGSTHQPSTGTFTFNVTRTDEKGFISRANNRYLKYDSGDPYYPIGDSYPWWIVDPWRATSNGKEKGTNIVKHYLDDMSANGFTYNRFELGFYEGLSLYGRDYVLQKTFHHYYNQHDAWQLDEIMDYAKVKGVNFNLAMFASVTMIDNGPFWYLGPDDNDGIPNFYASVNSKGDTIKGAANGNWSMYNPYNAFLDVRYLPTAPDTIGTARSLFDFLSQPESIRDQKKMLRYVVARWGYCTNLMGFELHDEMAMIKPDALCDLNPHFVPPPPHLERIYRDWAAALYDYLKSIDPNQHLISTALGDGSDTLLANQINAKMDFVNVHWYFGYDVPDYKGWRIPGEYSFADAVKGWAKMYDKPVGIMEMNWTADGITQDPHYYELHNLIWSALFNGSMGLSAVWAHEVEVLGHNAINQYIGVSAYSKILPQLSDQDVPTRIQENGLKWEFLQDPVEDEIHGRVQDENFTFLSIWQGQYGNYLNTWAHQDRPPFRSPDHQGSLPVQRPGLYRVQWYNTETGQLHSTEQVASVNGKIPLRMPNELSNATWADAGFVIHFVEGQPSLLLYPNPSSGLFQVELKHDSDAPITYRVYSVLGSELRRETLAAGDHSFGLDLTNFADGIYLLAVSIGEQSFSKVLVKD